MKEQASAYLEKSRDLLGRADTMMGVDLTDDAGRDSRHFQLVWSGQPDAGDWQGGADLLPTRATDFRPDLEFLGPGSSMIRGSDMIAAEVEKVIDVVVS